MSGDTPADTEFSRNMLAANDMAHVAAVARLIADHDPEFHPFGVFAAAPAGIDERQQRALQLRAEHISGALRDLHLRSMVETGLIVTYARPFTEGRGSGFPIPVEQFVPADKQELQERMLELRHQVQAHIDASAPEGFRRRVTRTEEPGVSSVTLGGPRYLSQEELRQLAELADDVRRRLEAELPVRLGPYP
jgi:hypothetical protein